MSQADVDQAALATRLGKEPNPRNMPTGVLTEYFQKDGVQVATQWRTKSPRLRSLVLTWTPATSAETPAKYVARDTT